MKEILKVIEADLKYKKEQIFDLEQRLEKEKEKVHNAFLLLETIDRARANPVVWEKQLSRFMDFGTSRWHEHKQ